MNRLFHLLLCSLLALSYANASNKEGVLLEIRNIEKNIYSPEVLEDLPQHYLARAQAYHKLIRGADFDEEPIIQTLSAVNDYLSQTFFWQSLSPSKLKWNWEASLLEIKTIEKSTRDILANRQLLIARSQLRRDKPAPAIERLKKALELTKDDGIRAEVLKLLNDLGKSAEPNYLELPAKENYFFKLSPFSSTESIQLYLAIYHLQQQEFESAGDLLRLFRQRNESFFYNAYLQILLRFPAICAFNISVCSDTQSKRKTFDLGEFALQVQAHEFETAYQTFYRDICTFTDCSGQQPLLFVHSQRLFNNPEYQRLQGYFLATVELQQSRGKEIPEANATLLKIFSQLHRLHLLSLQPPSGQRSLSGEGLDYITYLYCNLLINQGQNSQAKLVLQETLQTSALPTHWIDRAKKLDYR